MSLPISSVVDVSVSITPSSPPKIGFGIAAIVSSELPISGIPAIERLTYYSSITEIADVYSASRELYKSANAYFSQSPAPNNFGVITQYLDPTFAVLTGGTQVDTNIATWQNINDGSFEIDISGIGIQMSAINFGFVTDMFEVATVIQTTINSADASVGFANATVSFDSTNTRFIITSGEVAGSISFTIPGLTGTDISLLMQTEINQGGNIVNGRGAETIIDALNEAEKINNNWYGILLVNTVRDLQIIEDVAAWTESRVKLFATVTHNPNTLLLGNSDNIASRLQASNFTRTTVIYSSNITQYPDAAMLAKAFVVDFDSPLSVITLKFKSFAGILSEKLSTNQKNALDDKRANAYLDISSTQMYAEGFMSSQLFLDERHGTDWLVGELEFGVFNYLLSRTTKVPLTDAGTSSIMQQVIRVLDSARRNGLIGAGETIDGEFLPNGYIVSIGKIADMPIGNKQQRIVPPITFIALLTGAAHFVQINGLLER